MDQKLSKKITMHRIHSFERINELYFPSRSRIKYLTKLFEDKAKNELKLVDLKRN